MASRDMYVVHWSGEKMGAGIVKTEDGLMFPVRFYPHQMQPLHEHTAMFFIHLTD